MRISSRGLAASARRAPRESTPRPITAGQDVDVVEIDAASNRGIDEIRSLRQNVAVRPARGRFKVYIIDEVHMLTKEAFNALLKTLEEPPGHVKFVFCTTEPEKLPITILSRCQRFDFVTVDEGPIARRLAQIVEAEGAEVTAEALHLIARRAAGSMRDSQSLLEQLLGAATGPVGVDDVHAVIGTGSEERIGELLTAIAAHDAAAAVAVLDAALAGGADPGGVLEQLLAALRDCLLASVGCDEAMLAGSAGLGVDVAATGRNLGTATVLAMLQILDQALSRMRTSGHAAVLAEMAVVRLAAIEDLEGLAAAVDRVAAAGASGAGSSTAGAATLRPAAGRGGAPEKKTTDLTKEASSGPVARRSAGVVSPPAASASETQGPPDEASPEAAAATTSRPARSEDAERLPVIEAEAAWRAVAESLGGLGEDLAATASAVAWRDDSLEVTFRGRLSSQARLGGGHRRRPRGGSRQGCTTCDRDGHGGSGLRSAAQAGGALAGRSGASRHRPSAGRPRPDAVRRIDPQGRAAAATRDRTGRRDGGSSGSPRQSDRGGRRRCQ